MNPKVIGIIIAAIALAASSAYLLYGGNDSENAVTAQYHMMNLGLKDALLENQVLMSNPIKISTAASIAKYCDFFNDSQIDSIQYCTSTELKDSAGNFLGNIHMVGTDESVTSVVVVAQTDSSMSQIESVKSLFSGAVGYLVCDCWNEVQPGGFQSVGHWVSALGDLHSDESKVAKSGIDSLEGKDLNLEISVGDVGYLWTLVISL